MGGVGRASVVANPSELYFFCIFFFFSFEKINPSDTYVGEGGGEDFGVGGRRWEEEEE